MSKEKILKFPDNFLWGVSTSAYQIEGGIENDWSQWEKSEVRITSLQRKPRPPRSAWLAGWHASGQEKFPPKAPARQCSGTAGGDQPMAEEEKGLNPTDFICGQACDSYNRYLEDIKLIKDLNCQAYRFSIEWSRIEPEPGKFDELAIKHYLDQIKELKKNGIEPFVTLWHWTNPLWIAKLGGWENKKTIVYFLKYAEKIVGELGQEVNYWLTLNEPETYVGLGYVAGIFPPQAKSLFKANQVFINLMAAHRQVYRTIKERFKSKAQVGLSHYLIYQTPYGNNFFNRWLVKILDYIRWQRFLKASKNYEDFIGFQYYHHDRIKLKLGGRFLIAEAVNENKEITDVGWEIYPEGIYHLLKYFKNYNKPIYIIENGIADEDGDQRQKFIIDHLKYVHRAITEGVDVRGYFYWSLIDNFEWQRGWAPKFGLYAVNRKTFERTPRPSARMYGEICGSNSIKI